YENQPISKRNRFILDLCCGTGQLATHFLENGYSVLGIDLSEDMLSYARKNAAQYLENGQAEFRKGDATEFLLDQQFGLIISTFDSLNHLESYEAIKNCFRCVYGALLMDGFFIFDLNTRLGLIRWNEIFIQDTQEAMVVTRGIYDGKSDKAQMRISGFVQTPAERYERFSETIFNTVFELEQVKQSLQSIGWQDVYFAKGSDLGNPIDDPEREGRIFCIAKK
ncbi:MAG: class I SAM-dependent DNA methyltransferase, partial [Candidatus Hodarchaeota archaeon]